MAQQDLDRGTRSRGRIAYVISRFPLISETFILREIEELRTRGWEVTLVPLLRAKTAVRHAESEHWERTALFTPFISPAIVAANVRALLSNPARYIGLWAQVLLGTATSANYFVGALGVLPKSVFIAERLRQRGVQHVHAHYMTHPTVAALVISRLLGVQFSVTSHAHDLYVDQAMLRQKARAANFLVTISEFNKRFIARHAGAETFAKTHVIHCGVLPETFRPTPQAESHPFKILAVASLQPYKGLIHLVHACALLRDRGVAFDCRIVGQGELRDHLQSEISRLNLARQVHLLGAQPQHRVAEEMANANVLALPSIVASTGKMEGLPVVLMEALASNRPVVATRISGIPELVQHEHSGLLVEPGDPVGLADAMQRLQQDPPLAARLAANGRELVEAEFDLRKNVSALERLFDGVLAHQQEASHA